MVRLLIRMKAAQLRHGTAGKGHVADIIAVAIGLVSSIGTLLIGFVHYPSAASGADVLGLVLAAWVIGRVAFGAFAGGDATLRPEIFRLLPIPRRRLARALLVVGFVDPSLVFLAIAFGSLIALGAQYGAWATLVAVIGLLVTLALTSVLVTTVGAVMAAPSRRRRGIGTFLVAMLISLVAIAGPLLPTFIAALTSQSVPALSAVVRVLPSGWAAAAVGLAAGDAPALALLPLAGLVLLTLAVAGCWPLLLGRRLDGSAAASHHARLHRRRARLLPATPTGAVVAKELRQWARDPMRATLMMIAAIVGIGACVVPFLSRGTAALMPFAGLMTIVIAGAVACNLIGGDGLALRLTAAIPHSARPDLRGRQLAWLLVVGPYSVVVTVVLTLVSGQAWAWPLVLAGAAALLGGAAGLVPLASVVRVQPLDENGGLTAGWPVKVYACLFLILLTAAPAAVPLVLGAITGEAWLLWLAVPVGIATGAASALWLPRVAVRRLEAHQLDLLAVLATASSPA